MLKNIDPLLNAELLYVLRAIGHGDDIVLADANFPAETMASKHLIRMDGVDGPRMLQAILSVMPIDDFVPDPALALQVVGRPDEIPEICAIYDRMVQEASGGTIRLSRIERFAFYERARAAFAVVATGEARLYGNILLKKGVIRPQSQ